MCERVGHAHIKRTLQAGIEECIPTGALCHILRVHVLCLCMRPELGGIFRSNFFVILPRPTFLYISSANIRILGEDDVNEMWVAPKNPTKLPFENIIVVAYGSQMMLHLTDHSHSQSIDPQSDVLHDKIDTF